jgi:hypothetical protein
MSRIVTRKNPRLNESGFQTPFLDEGEELEGHASAATFTHDRSFVLYDRRSARATSSSAVGLVPKSR